MNNKHMSCKPKKGDKGTDLVCLMKKHVFIFSFIGVCFSQIVPDTLILKSGKTYLGTYYGKDDTYTEFKYQKSMDRGKIRNSYINEIRFANKKSNITFSKKKNISKSKKDNKQFGGGGLGFGGRLGYNFFGELDGYYDLERQKRNRIFVGLGGNTPGERTEDNTYDFNEDLFGDSKLGKQTEYTYLVGGLVERMGQLSMYYGGGFTIATEYFKRNDTSEILGSEGVYFVEDDDGGGWNLTGTIGFMFDNSSNAWNVSKTGVIVNINPLFINFVMLW